MSGGGQGQCDVSRGGAEVLSFWGSLDRWAENPPMGCVRSGTPPAARTVASQNVHHPLREASHTCSEVLWDPLEGGGLPRLAGLVFFLTHLSSTVRAQLVSGISTHPLHARSEAGGVGADGSMGPLTNSHSFVSHFRVIIEPPIVRVF